MALSNLQKLKVIEKLNSVLPISPKRGGDPDHPDRYADIGPIVDGGITIGMTTYSHPKGMGYIKYAEKSDTKNTYRYQEHIGPEDGISDGWTTSKKKKSK
jgi:hypothetical protein